MTVNQVWTGVVPALHFERSPGSRDKPARPLTDLTPAVHRLTIDIRSWQRLPLIAASFLAIAAHLPAQQRPLEGSVSGIVVTEEGLPLDDATIRIARTDDTAPREVTSDGRGAFLVSSLPAGLYRVSARRIGYRPAELPLLRVIAGQTAEIRVMLTRSPTQLSTVTVRATATSIDASTTELAQRIELRDVQLVPMGRDAASLVELVPGARKGSVWGAGGEGANSYQLDGVAVNHPGVGGDFLAPSIDWIDAMEVRGLGAGAEHGGFQGGIINAITRAGTNDWRGGLGAHYVSPSLTASNVRQFEEGAEQTMRRELAADLAGPLVRDRLLGFAALQLVERDVQVPDLSASVGGHFRPVRQEFRDLRGIVKLTVLPSSRDRLDALAGHTGREAERAELNGIDDPAASLRVREPTTFYSLLWTHTAPVGTLDVRIGGFDARETRLGYEGDGVPGVQIFSVGRQPAFQNATFNERLRPRSIGGSASWSMRQALADGENQVVLGAEYTRGTWRHQRTRNGGLTWRPYPDPSTGALDPARPETWAEVASEWGGEIRIHSEVEDIALFIQDYLTLGPALTFTPGLRYGRWTGWLSPRDAPAERFEAVRHQAVDPRMGVVWDVTGRNELVMKAHWGRYHQGMQSVFFDRAAGADAYTNRRFYFQGPELTDPRTVFTPEERDAMQGAGGFPATFTESILNEAGRVERYRQPYVDQWVLGFERTLGPRWKAEFAYVNRVNKDIAGLVDNNLAENYSLLTDVAVRHRISQAPVLDQNGQPLVIRELWIANDDLRAELQRRQAIPLTPPVPGYTFADIARLTYEPDIVLTTVLGARRQFHQLSFSIRTEHSTWSGLASITATRLTGNVPGMTGFGTIGNSFSAGWAVRPNEALNNDGRLPNAPVLESRIWFSTELPWGFQGGAFTTISAGEHITPQFQITERFRFVASDGSALDDVMFNRVRGQTLLLESRGHRRYPAHAILDLRLARTFSVGRSTLMVTADVFNVLGSDAVIARNLTVNDQVTRDPTSLFGAPRLRVSPRAVRVGSRIGF